MPVTQSLVDQRMALQRQIRSVEQQLQKASEMITSYRALHSNVSFNAPATRQDALKRRLTDMEAAHRSYVNEMRAIKTELSDQLTKLV